MSELLYDWNDTWSLPPFSLLDETLRDGIQSPSVRNPDIGEKLELLHLMEAAGITHADIGLPGAGAQEVSDVTRLVTEIRDQRLRVRPNFAARTHPKDIQAVIDISQATGYPIEVCAFLGSSPMRRFVEGWELEQLEDYVATSLDLAVGNQLPVSFVTEDTIRTDPETLRRLFRVAVDHGATRLILTDTVGHATPSGVVRLVRFTRSLLAEWGVGHVQLDWHGHSDRGLSLALCLEALREGVERIHATCLGLGERAGNAPLDLLIINLRLLGYWPHDLQALRRYVEKVSAYLQVPIPFNYPALGQDAFRTATGVHAAAILKASECGRPDLMDRIYSSIPAAELGSRQRIEVGYYSGRANIRMWLSQHDLPLQEDYMSAIWELAKRSDRVLSEEVILDCLRARVDGADRSS